MVWTKNLILYNDKGKVGKCPKCNSENVKVTEHKHGPRQSLSFMCKKCGSADHFDGITTE